MSYHKGWLATSPKDRLPYMAIALADLKPYGRGKGGMQTVATEADSGGARRQHGVGNAENPTEWRNDFLRLADLVLGRRTGQRPRATVTRPRLTVRRAS